MLQRLVDRGLRDTTQALSSLSGALESMVCGRSLPTTLTFRRLRFQCSANGREKTRVPRRENQAIQSISNIRLGLHPLHLLPEKVRYYLVPRIGWIQTKKGIDESENVFGSNLCDEKILFAKVSQFRRCSEYVPFIETITIQTTTATGEVCGRSKARAVSDTADIFPTFRNISPRRNERSAVYGRNRPGTYRQLPPGIG
jgi:hypothetical protein